MLIKETSISVTYKRISGVKKAYYNNEHILKKYFNEATVLPVPDDAPDEIPRIIVKTLHEHAQLNITPVATTLQIVYNDGFERNWDSCVAYIQERMTTVFEFLNILTDNHYDYIGIVTNIIMDNVMVDGAKILAKNILKEQEVDKIYDLDVKYTFVEEKNIFVNIMLRNARLFKEGISINNAGDLAVNNQIAESIAAIIDINDRYGFNSDQNYRTDSSQLNNLISKMSNVINTKLNLLIEQGVY